jgi:hypothetical protein
VSTSLQRSHHALIENSSQKGGKSSTRSILSKRHYFHGSLDLPSDPMQPSRQLNPLQMLRERKANSIVENLTETSVDAVPRVKRTKPSVLKNLSILEGTFPRKFAGSFK